MKILITSTSFQSLTGMHYDVLKRIPDLELDQLKGPLPIQETLKYADKYDGIICGDDDYNEDFFKRAEGKLKILSKYGVGLDKIDLAAAKKYNIPVRSCPGVNSTTVAEHVFALLLTNVKNIISSSNSTKNGEWYRPVGSDLLNKHLGLIGLGNIGSEVAIRAKAFGMVVSAYDPFAKVETFTKLGVKRITDLNKLIMQSNIISLHVPLTNETRNIVSKNNFQNTTLSPIVINTSRGGLINEAELIELLNQNKIAAYLTDVLDIEPISTACKINKHPKVLITTHIGSRTTDNILNQARMASMNLLKELGLE